MTDHDRRYDEQGSHSTRVPPHNLEAEEAALGAALLSEPAADELLEHLKPDDFYNPRNAYAFAALRRVRSAHDPVDVVTLADQLRRDGLLEEVGGIEQINGWQNATPSVSAVPTYVRIIRDCSQLRRLVFASSKIADIAFGGGAEPSTAIGKAQELLEGLDVTAGADLVTTLDVADIAALLETDLEPERGCYFTRSDGASLFYPGKTHVLQAEPSAGKSWLALWAVVEVLALGGSAGYLDFEDTPSGILRRLRYLGASEEAMRDRFFYIRPTGKLEHAERAQLERILEAENPDIVVIDGVGESLSRNGMSEDKADDVLRWYDLLPRPIAESGAAVVMIDHVSKDPEQRGRWARGSGAKLGALDGAAYQVKVSTSFSRNKAGTVRLIIAKDRPGGVGAIGDTAAIVKITPHGGGERVVLEVEPYSDDLASTDRHMPTHVMTELSKAIEEAKIPPTAKNVQYLVHAKKATIEEALTRLQTDGFVTERGRRKELISVKPYRGQTWHTEPAGVDLEAEEPPQLFETDEVDPLADEHADSLTYLAANDEQQPTPHYDREEF